MKIETEIGWGHVIADELAEWPHAETGNRISCRFTILAPLHEPQPTARKTWRGATAKDYVP